MLNIKDEEFAAAAKANEASNLMIFPIDVTITRFYHTYVTAIEGTPVEKLKELAMDMILESQGDCLCDDQDMDIEEDDIQHMSVRDEDAWLAVESEDIERILKEMKHHA